MTAIRSAKALKMDSPFSQIHAIYEGIEFELQQDLDHIDDEPNLTVNNFLIQLDHCHNRWF